ncbi:MAG: type I-E CRISPR-associated protein Cas6/Cse3/CasE [bacterium]
MHLSELSMDWSLTQNPYKIHRHLWQAFPGMPDSNRPFLFRVNPGKKGEPSQVIMQSDVTPNRASLPHGCSLLRTKGVSPSFREGQFLRFLVCANPTKRLNQARCRVPLIDETALIDWLAGKLNEAAELEEAQVFSKRILYFRKDNQPGKIVTVTFSGILLVRSPEKLLNLVQRGIGPAKSFGCGLLSLARA